MVQGWNRQRAYNLEGARLISYTIAGANRDPKKPFPSITSYLPLVIDEGTATTREDDIKKEQAELIERINKAFGKNLKASA
jgi:hypothetical protein